MRTEITVSAYLLMRLKQMGVDHLFGVPGDFVLGFLNELLASDVQYIGTCNELNAAYAADGYARIRGVGALATTFGVGELSAINGIAGAHAERIPIVVITGSPSTAQFKARPLLHHTLGDYQIPLQMYEPITVATTQLMSGQTAPAEIDRVLTACLVHRRPVYIRLPSDVVRMNCEPPTSFLPLPRITSDPDALREAVLEAATLLNAAQRPLVIGGVSLIRYQLQAQFAELLEKTGFPYVTMMLAKTLLSEHHPQFVGLFEGDRSRDAVRKQVDTADCILELGAWMTDFNTGGFTAHLDPLKRIRAGLHSVQIHHHTYDQVGLQDFLAALEIQVSRREARTFSSTRAADGCVHRAGELYLASPEAPLTVDRFFDRVSHFIAERAIILAETGVSLFSAAEMLMPPGATFIGQTFYGSIGYTVGATLGAAVAAPDRQVVLFVGDGAFQVTAQELSTLIRQRLKPIIFLLNNDGYTIERVICDRDYNDIQPWKYHKLVDIFGGGLGLDVYTEGDLESALTHAAKADDLVFIEIHTGRLDCPDALRNAGLAMAASSL